MAGGEGGVHGGAAIHRDADDARGRVGGLDGEGDAGGEAAARERDEDSGEVGAVLHELATVLVPLSGGGLAAGVALAVKSANPATRVIGISMDRGAAMHAAFAAGHPVPIVEVESLADSLGGGLGADNRLTYSLCRALLDDILLVTEPEIYRAMQALYWHDRLVTEGAAAVGAAALLSGRVAPAGPAALLVTGRNVDMPTFTRVVTGQPVPLGSLTLEGRPYAA